MTTSHYYPAPKPKRDRRGTALIIAMVVLLVIGFITCAGIVAGGMTPDGGDPVPTFVTPSTTRPTTTPATTKPTTADPTAGRGGAVAVHEIKGDDTVHIGEDVPAGTYRVIEAVEPGSFCYWVKSRDSEADQIIDNGVPTGGRPQVVLKTGQWFTSQGCPNWRRR